VVGYERYGSPQEIDWLNAVYACLDEYANLFLPMRKIISKTRVDGKVRKRYDTARTPLQRLIDLDVLETPMVSRFQTLKSCSDPLRLHEHQEKLIQEGPERYLQTENFIS
jgi:hypothetical protein